jgi:hypothetical protein
MPLVESCPGTLQVIDMTECAGTSYVAHALAVAQGLVPLWTRIGPTPIYAAMEASLKD